MRSTSVQRANTASNNRSVGIALWSVYSYNKSYTLSLSPHVIFS